MAYKNIIEELTSRGMCITNCRESTAERDMP